jgi:integrase
VYRSCSGSYEIAYRDSDGKLVFKVVPGGFEDAKAARANVVGKLARGEKIRDSKELFGPFAESVVAAMSTRPRTLEKHRYYLARHLQPRFGARKLSEVDTDAVARFVREMRAGVYFEKVDDRYVRRQRRGGYSGSTIAGALGTLGLVMGRAKRRGLVGSNPVGELERDERPKLEKPERRVLDNAEIRKLLEYGGTLRPLIALLIFSGLRLGEALGLRWGDIDDDAGFIHVRQQLGRDRKTAPIKTAAGRRDVVLVPQLARVLREHRVAALHSIDHDFVFPAPDGKGRDHRSVSRGIERAVERAELGVGISAHSFRHTFASQLIVGMGLDPVRIAHQLGHTNAAFTASCYAHLFEQARHADELRERLELGYGRLLDVNPNVHQRPKTAATQRQSASTARVANLASVAAQGG